MTWFDAAKISGVFTAFGIDGEFDLGDPRHQGEAVVAYINAHGGIAGRQVVPVWYEQQSSEDVSEDGKARQAQAMCATFTEDHEVSAILQGFQGHDGLASCAVQKGVPLVTSSYTFSADREWFSSIGEYFYMINHMLTDRRDRVYVDSLAGQGFFSPGSRVGLLVEDRPQIRRSTDRALKPALAAHGVTVVAEAFYDPDIVQAPWPSYVLQLQTAGVTHVVWSASDVVLTTSFFMRAAENQQYRPRYGLSSDLSPSFNAIVAPREQLKGAVGVGWLPAGDVGDTATPVSANDVRCREVMVAAGEPEYAAAGQGYCELLFFLQAALAGADTLTPASLSAGTARLGDSYASVFTPGTRFGPGRHDGANVVRDFAFDDGCGCFRYLGEPRRLEE